MPRMYAVAYHDARRAKMKKFPYLVYYRVFENKIEISSSCMEVAILKFGGNA